MHANLKESSLIRFHNVFLLRAFIKSKVVSNCSVFYNKPTTRFVRGNLALVNHLLIYNYRECELISHMSQTHSKLVLLFLEINFLMTIVIGRGRGLV